MILLREKNIEKPYPGFIGTFQYNALTKLSRVGSNQKIIWGFESNEVTMEEVISKVVKKDLDVFIKNVRKKEQVTTTPTINLTNGNAIREIYHKNFHEECLNCEFDCGELIGIKGKTYMVA